MANRYLSHSYAVEKQVVNLFAKVSFGATGAPTLSLSASKGIKSVTRVSAGKYTFTFGTSAAFPGNVDTYKKFFQAQQMFVNASLVPAAPIMYVSDDSSATAGTVTIQFAAPSGASGALVATDPASGEVALFDFTFGNSSAY